MRIPGGRPAALVLGGLGFTTTLVTIAFSVIPANDEPHKALAVAKIVGLTALLLAVGVFAFAWGKSHAAKNPA
jgi:glutamate:GABA antiporter